jgi:hypothetical protein
MRREWWRGYVEYRNERVEDRGEEEGRGRG